MEFLTNFARSLQQTPVAAPPALMVASKPLVEEEPEPAFPIFKTTLRPATASTLSPVRKSVGNLKIQAAPSQLKQKNVLGAKPAGVLKNKPKTAYLTTEISSKLKEHVTSHEGKAPQFSTDKVFLQPVQPPPSPPSKRINHRPAYTTPAKKPQRESTPAPTSSGPVEHPLAVAFKGLSFPKSPYCPSLDHFRRSLPETNHSRA